MTATSGVDTEQEGSEAPEPNATSLDAVVREN